MYVLKGTVNDRSASSNAERRWPSGLPAHESISLQPTGFRLALDFAPLCRMVVAPVGYSHSVAACHLESSCGMLSCTLMLWDHLPRLVLRRERPGKYSLPLVSAPCWRRRRRDPLNSPSSR